MNICLYCKTTFKKYRGSKGLFCSVQCSNRSRSIIKKCLNCEIEFSSNKVRHSYCSKKCQGEYKTKENIRKWLLGEITGSVKRGASAYIKIYLISLRGNKCEECGWDKINPITGKCPIELDHKDGNYQNNRIENLRLLCPNCHSLTSTFRNLNKGNGREYRNKVSPLSLKAE